MSFPNIGPCVGCRGVPRRPRLQVLAIVLLSAMSSRAQVEEQEPQSLPQQQEPKDRGEELQRRLIREAGGETAGDVMSEILRLMQDSSRRLEVEFDAGSGTSDVQRRILENLDLAIAEAARRSRPPSGGSSSASGDKRRRPETRPPRKRDSNAGTMGRDDSPSDAAPPGVEPVRVNLPSGELRELRAGWGNLPQREREEMIQGVDEAYLDRYRAWIERYYRALQEDSRPDAGRP